MFSRFSFFFSVLIFIFSVEYIEASNCSDIFLHPPSPRYLKALVIGGGTFGTAIATVFSENSEEVSITTRDPEFEKNTNDLHIFVNKINKNENNLPKNITAIMFEDVDYNSLLNKGIDVVAFAIPLNELHDFLDKHKEFFDVLVKKNIPFVSLSKGIEIRSLSFADDIFLGLWPELEENLTFLSGPSYADEIIEEYPTFVTLAGKNEKTLKIVQSMMTTPNFQISLTKDIKTVLMGGSIKNVIAIAMGIAEGLKAGSNTKAGLLTLLYKEVIELLTYLGDSQVEAKTLYDFSVLGDIYLSSEGLGSRNKKFGRAIAEGLDIEKFIKNNTVEGYYTVHSMEQIIKREGAELPLFSTLFQILYEKSEPQSLIQALKKSKHTLSVAPNN